MKDQMHQLIAHYGGIAGIGAKLGVDNLAHGVASATVDLHREVFGPNRYKSIPPANFFVLLYRVLNDPMLLLLCAAALISTVLGAAIEKERKKGVWAEGVAIWVAVIIVSLVGAINDWSKDRQVR
jgi:P-type Ca2+ transporter type 2C